MPATPSSTEPPVESYSPTTTSKPAHVLVINPGGPGTSGVTFLRKAVDGILSPMASNEALVSFDPRGVGSSSPVVCGSLKDLVNRWDITGVPSVSQTRAVEAYRNLVADCVAKQASLLKHVGTEDAARDLDVLRAALGQSKLDYLGFSYGTLLGATYLSLFPKQAGHFVLDGPMDLNGDLVSHVSEQAASFEDSWTNFLTWCTKDKHCKLPHTVKGARSRVLSLLDSLASNPIKLKGGRVFTKVDAEFVFTSALYAGPYMYPSMSATRTELLAGKADSSLKVVDSSDGRVKGSTSGAYVQNLAVDCRDYPMTPSEVETGALEVSLTKVSPTFATLLSWNNFPCSLWPVHGSLLPSLNFKDIPPVLVIGATHDPATPYVWAKAVSSRLPSSVLLTREGYGHTSYGRGSSCVDVAVDDFLLDGSLPSPAARTCTTDIQTDPFDGLSSLG
jgi:pimeloyl-ACP methyl ester carboxylesterase